MESVQVYVRLGANQDETSRRISFTVPKGISQDEVLERGYAIDGRDALMEVTKSYDINEQRDVPLGEALRDEQVELKTWLGEKGFAVTFV